MVRASSQTVRVRKGFDPFQQMKSALATETPWESILDFALHPSFCGLKLYPRQQTLLKLIYLETENMTEYDLDVINGWAESFLDRSAPEGVQPDIWERVAYLKANGYRRFPHVQMVMGRRASKGVIGGILGAETVGFMYSLGDFQQHYGLPPGKDAYFMTYATNMVQAKRFQFADIRSTIERCQYLQPAISTNKEYTLTLRTPADERRLLELERSGVPIEREFASLQCVAMTSNSASGRGAAAFGLAFDEMAHAITGTDSTKSSESTYAATTPALDQFGKDSLVYIPSSPLTRVGKFYELYKDGCITLDEYNRKHGRQLPVKDEEEKKLDAEEGLLKAVADPEMLVVQLPSWEPYMDWERGKELVGIDFKRAIQYPPFGEAPENLRMKRLEARDPEKFKVERRAQFADVVDAYLNPRKVDQMFEPFWGGRVLSEQIRGRTDRQYRIHFDPGYSNADFAVCVAHTELSPEPDEFGKRWPHVIIDYLHVWKAKDYPDGLIDYVEVLEDIRQLLRRFPSATEVTFDQWNSAQFIAQLKREVPDTMRVREFTFSKKVNMEVAEKFKTALNLGWVHAYKDDLYEGTEGSLLELELKFLQLKNGQVEKQSFGPVTKKDLSDCAQVVTVELLKDSLERHERTLLGHGSYGTTSLYEAEKVVGLSPSRNSRYADKFREQAIDRRRGFDSSRNRRRF